MSAPSRCRTSRLLSGSLGGLSAFILLYACGQRAAKTSSPQQGLSIVTDSLSYGLRYTTDLIRVDIGATITNRTEDVVYFDTFCNGQLDKLLNEGWHSAYSRSCRLGSGSAEVVAIAPGHSYQTRFPVSASRLGDNPRFKVDSIPGVYRLVYHIYSGIECERSQLLPEDERASNRFTLRE